MLIPSEQTEKQWSRLTNKRRSGIIVPLFSIWSKNSIGVGDFFDLRHIVKWCKQTGLSIIQLLPMNDVGYDFAPYNSLSSFALEPMYLSLKDLRDTNLLPFKDDIKELKKKFKPGNSFVNYEIKKEKLEILWEMFQKTYVGSNARFERFKKLNSYWLEDYAIYKVIKENLDGKSWEEWAPELKEHNPGSIYQYRLKNQKRYEYYSWMQWQIYEQFIILKRYAEESGIYLMGDIPFLVSRDSADVWAHQSYFKLDISSGAPPDMYFAKGQRWGMPPYNWQNIESNNYRYINERLKYAEHFYDMFRIDHFVGLFRVWTINNETPVERGGLDGIFDPSDESLWKSNGEKILKAMLESSKMLPCAEDLGVVPACSFEVLKENAIPGTDVQRWVKERNEKYDFIPPEYYRENSISTIATHDSSGIIEWWLNEAGTIDAELFTRLYNEKGISADSYFEKLEQLFDTTHTIKERLLWKKEINSVDKLLDVLCLSTEKCWDIVSLYLDSYNEKEKFLRYIGIDIEEKDFILDSAFVQKTLMQCSKSNSVFMMQLIGEWLSIDEYYLNYQLKTPVRINYPGIVSDKNWRSSIPYPVENFQFFSINKTILEMNKLTGRL